MNIFGDIGYLLKEYWSFFLKGTISTIVLSVFGTFVGLLLGIFLALGKNLKTSPQNTKFGNIWRGIIKGICSIYSTVIRGTPMMVQAMIFKYSCQAMGVNWNLILHQMDVFNGWFVAGLIVITFNTAAYMGEIVKSGINGVDAGQYEGARSLGMTHFQAYRYVIFPQAIKNALPTIANEWIVNIKDSSVLNVIGVAELYFQSGQAANKGYKFIAAYVIVAIIYLLLTLCVSGLIKLLEKKLNGESMKISFFHFRKVND